MPRPCFGFDVGRDAPLLAFLSRHFARQPRRKPQRRKPQLTAAPRYGQSACSLRRCITCRRALHPTAAQPTCTAPAPHTALRCRSTLQHRAALQARTAHSLSRPGRMRPFRMLQSRQCCASHAVCMPPESRTLQRAACLPTARRLAATPHAQPACARPQPLRAARQHQPGAPPLSFAAVAACIFARRRMVHAHRTLPPPLHVTAKVMPSSVFLDVFTVEIPV